MRNIVNKNKTAFIVIAGILGFILISCCGIGSIASHTNKPTPTVTITATVTVTETATSIATSIPTNTPVNTHTSTPTSIPPTEVIVPSATMPVKPTQKPVEATKVVKPSPVPVIPTEAPVVVPTNIPTDVPVAENFDYNGDGKVNCKDFKYMRDAKRALAAGYKDLDGDSNGIPCESTAK
jgi:hypothetical protein